MFSASTPGPGFCSTLPITNNTVKTAAHRSISIISPIAALASGNTPGSPGSPIFKTRHVELVDIILLFVPLNEINFNFFIIFQKAIEEKYGIPCSQLWIYIHYQPSFYHLHVHFTYLKYDAPGIALTSVLKYVGCFWYIFCGVGMNCVIYLREEISAT
jgi:hypothetical protein